MYFHNTLCPLKFLATGQRRRLICKIVKYICAGAINGHFNLSLNWRPSEAHSKTMKYIVTIQSAMVRLDECGSWLMSSAG